MPLPDEPPVAGAWAGREREGWERRFVAGGERLEEAVALYRRIGYAVRVERPTAAELGAACGACRLALRLFGVVYTRRAP